MEEVDFVMIVICLTNQFFKALYDLLLVELNGQIVVCIILAPTNNGWYNLEHVGIIQAFIVKFTDFYV